MMDDEAHSRAYPATYTPSSATAPQVSTEIKVESGTSQSKSGASVK